MPIYLTGYIDEYTDRWKHYNGDVLPLGMIVQPKTHREGYLRRAGLYTWVAIDNGRFTEAGRRLFRPAGYDRLIAEGLERAGDHLLFATAVLRLNAREGGITEAGRFAVTALFPLAWCTVAVVAAAHLSPPTTVGSDAAALGIYLALLAPFLPVLHREWRRLRREPARG